MKRGRPTVRIEVQREIIEVLSSKNVPMTTSSIANAISKKLGKKVSWNTIEKYINELVAMDKVSPIVLPHSKLEGKDGLTVYTIKK